MRIGIIGCGLMGQRRAAYLEPDDVLVGGYDVAYPSGWIWIRKDVESLIEESEALVVATPHDLLASMALRCVQAGKHVLLEKPCARTGAELSPILLAMKDAEVVVVPGFTLRHYPGVAMASSFLEGRKPRCLRVLYGHPGRPGYEKEWRCNPKRGGGELLDQGVHLIDLTQFLFGRALLRDYCGQHGPWGPIDNSVFLRLVSPQGAVAILQASWVEPRPVFRLEVVCKDASVVVTGLDGGYGLHCVTCEQGTESTTASWPNAREMALREEWRSFKADVQEGRPRLSDALSVISIVDQTRTH